MCCPVICNAPPIRVGKNRFKKRNWDDILKLILQYKVKEEQPLQEYKIDDYFPKITNQMKKSRDWSEKKLVHILNMNISGNRALFKFSKK